MKKKSFWELTGRDVVGMIGRKIWGEARMPFRRGKYGQATVNVGTWESYKGKTYKMPGNRKDIYKTAWSYYLENQFARPITNLTASAVFGKGVQFVGDNEQVKFANKLFGQIDLFQLGVESGLDGDNFIRVYKDEEDYRLVLLPPDTMDKVIRDDNVADLKGYVQFKGNDTLEKSFEPNEIEHIMQNAVSNSLYGNSDLKHLFYWFDLYDSTTEEADKRRLFASQPIGVFTGVVMRFKSTLQTMLGRKARDVDQREGLRRSLPPGSNLLLPKGMEFSMVEPGGKFDLEEILSRIAKVIAMGSETPLHWLLLAEQINRACYSNDTETLTARGWKKYDEIKEDDVIGTFNPNNGRIEFCKPKKKYIYSYRGKMIHFLNKNIDVLVTPEHRMYAKRERNNPLKESYDILRAEEMDRNRFKFLQAVDKSEEDSCFDYELKEDRKNGDVFVLPSVPTGLSRAIYPEETVSLDLWLEFLGYFIAEGHAHKNTYHIGLAQKDEMKTAKITDCLNQLPFAFKFSTDNKGCHRFIANDKGLNLWLRENCGELANGKRLPDFWRCLGKRRLRILFDALMLGDGSIDKRENRTSMCYYTSSVILAGQMQELAMTLGYRAKIINGSRCKRILIREGRESVVGQQGIKLVDYEGLVYCFEVPNHLFITRRNGKIGIHGNTAREMAYPFIKKVLRKQRLFGNSFIEILQGIYDEDSEALGFDEEENKEGEFQLEAKFPPIFDYELEEIEKMIGAILKANMSGRLSAKTTLDLVCNYFGLDVEEEQKRLEDEEESAEEENEDEEFDKIDRAVGEIGAAVARGELKKKTATELIKKLVG